MDILVKKTIQFNECKTCGANGGKAGLLINKECENCYDTRNTGSIVIHVRLERTNEQIQRTMDILNERKH